jgi:pilus assembly protein Flp/PilA
MKGFHLTFSLVLIDSVGTSRSLMGATSMYTVSRFLRDNSGATAIEYGLIAAGISIAIVTVVGLVGDSLNVTFTKVDTALKAN